MKVRPLALLEPVLGNVMRGKCIRVRRAADGALAGVTPGDVFWIREAYHLNARYDAISPTSAARHGAWPAFVHDFAAKPKPEGLGKRRSARELRKEWHRAHLVVFAVERQRLQDITDAEIAADGFADRAAWAQDWDRNKGVSMPVNSGGRSWQDNPHVLVFTVCYVPAPAPAAAEPAQPKPTRRPPGPKPGKAAADRDRRARIRRELERPRPEPVALLDLAAPVSADGRTWCDQCQRRVTTDEGRSCTQPFCDAEPAKLGRAA